MSAVSLALAKQYLTVDYTDQDLVIQAAIDGAEEFVERITGCKLTSAAQTDYLDGGGCGLWPSRMPVTSVTLVTDTESGSAESASDWHLQKNGIFRDSQGRWDEGPVNRWKVEYVGGYVTVPAGLVMIVLDLVSRSWDARGGKTQQGAAGYGFQFDKFADSAMMQRLETYRPARAKFG
jgi:hypothetical protein